MDWLSKIPVGQYVSGNSGWLRIIDSRLKMAWVLMFLITPVLAGPWWRIGLVATLMILTVFSRLPLRIWWRSFLLALSLAFLIGLFSMFLPTSEVSSALATRSPSELPNVFAKGTPWYIFSLGPIQLGQIDLGPLLINRRSADLALNTSTLVFTVIHSVNLMLLTTPPEDLIWTLQWFLSPLAFLGFPVDRVSFQLLLSLRFIPLVQEEFQNLLRSLSIRAIDVRRLGFKTSLGLVVSVGERLLANILLRAEQGADALMARGGFLLPADYFSPKNLVRERSFSLNILSGILLLLVLGLRRQYGDL